MTRGELTANALTGIPSLIAFASITRIQKTDMSISSRLNMAVKLYSLLRAHYLTSKPIKTEKQIDDEIGDLLGDIGSDIKRLRTEYENVMDIETWASDAKNDFDLFLDSIEYRLDEVIVKSKILDRAGLREMTVPE